MKTYSKTVKRIVIVFALLFFSVVARGVYHKWREDKWAEQGQAAVEKYFRDGAGGEFEPYGKFDRIEGSGYYDPVWNIQGYHYLTLDRTAYFKNRAVSVRIYVAEGRVTAPGLKTMGTPRLEGHVSPLQGARIFVSHPDVVP